MPLVSRLELVTLVPCHADVTRMRFVAEVDADLTPALPYLNAVVARASFNPTSRSLTVAEDGSRFTFHGRRIAGSRLRDEIDAARRAQGWVDRINDVWERRAAIAPSYRRGALLTAVEIHRHLPATDCRECGETTCLELAYKIYDERSSILVCRPLFTPRWKERRLTLLGLLQAAGHEVPPDFLR